MKLIIFQQPGYMDDYLLDGDASEPSSASSASESESNSASDSSDWDEMGLTLLDERDRQRLSSAGSQERRRATSGASSLDTSYRLELKMNARDCADTICGHVGLYSVLIVSFTIFVNHVN